MLGMLGMLCVLSLLRVSCMLRMFVNNNDSPVYPYFYSYTDVNSFCHAMYEYAAYLYTYAAYMLSMILFLLFCWAVSFLFCRTLNHLFHPTTWYISTPSCPS